MDQLNWQNLMLEGLRRKRAARSGLPIAPANQQPQLPQLPVIRSGGISTASPSDNLSRLRRPHLDAPQRSASQRILEGLNRSSAAQWERPRFW
jgi:hypothetical protein